MNITELGDFVEQWSKLGYPFISEDKRAMTEKSLAELFKSAKTENKEAMEDIKFLNSKFLPPKLTDFDLKKHFQKLLDKCDGLDARQRALFEKKFDVANIQAKVPMERICCEKAMIPLVDEKTAESYQERAKSILNRIIETPKQPNKMLAEMLKDKEVIFLFEDSNERDAGISEIYIKDKRYPLMIIDKGMMDTNFISEDFLATTIAHELGHWIDFNNRPAEYLGKEKLWQECFADVSGYIMAKNAGYNADVMLSEREKFAKAHREYMERKGKNLPPKTIFEERYELLKNMFGKSKNYRNFMLQKAIDR